MPIHDLVQNSERPMPLVRTEPIQERSAARVDALLDAAAAVVDEIGFDRLTTAMVAERATASIGTVYRYFPDRIALLQALRNRAIARFRVAVVERMEEVRPSSWQRAIDCTVDAYVTMYRTEPGFRIIRFADDERGLTDRPGTDGESERFTAAFAAILASDFGLPAGPELTFRVGVAIELGDALVSRAFLSAKEGDRAYIAEAREVIATYLGTHYN